ncbi:lytic transglycosylase domain-containing protein [Caulobacter sp. LARHSG274]
MVLDAGEPGHGFVASRTTGKIPHATRVSVASIAALSLLTSAPSATARQADFPPAARAERTSPITQAVSEAARRFGLPEAWIYAVMRQESGGRVDAVSLKGAMGLLQLMPATWRELTRELHLGDDPYDARANVLAGSAYLRRLYDRFGAPGFLAAYNAGPERYAKHLTGAQSLPPETQAYVRSLAPLIREADFQSHPASPRTAGLFVGQSGSDEATDDALVRSIHREALWP